MNRTLLLSSLLLPMAAGCTFHSTETSRQFVGSRSYEVARVADSDGASEVFKLVSGDNLQVVTESSRQRPYLGVGCVELTKERAEERGVKPYSGLLVTSTAADSGARRAGIRQHDVLMALDGEAVVYEEQLVEAVAALRDGQQVQARLLRGDQVIEVPATVGLVTRQERDVEVVPLIAPTPAQRPYAGVTLRGVPADVAERMLGRPGGAAVVSQVEVGSPAWLAGVRGGDILEQVDGEAVPPVEELMQQVVLKGSAGETMTWKVRREAGQTYEAEVALSDYSGSSGVHVPLVLKANSGVYEDNWSLGMGLLMSNRNNYVVDQESREVETRNRFSMLLGLLKVDSMPEETKVRLLWFITLRAS